MLQPKFGELAIPEEVDATARAVVGAAFRVHRKLGAGFKESVYQQCLAHALRSDGLHFLEHPPLTVEFEGLVIKDAGQPDFLVNDTVVVELKAAEGVHPRHAAQVINDLKASDKLVGLLINFNEALLKDGLQRFVHPDILRKAGQPTQE